MSISERIHTVPDVVILTASLLLTTWFYYELYQTFRLSSLVL
jgi:hypothetical protein